MKRIAIALISLPFALASTAALGADGASKAEVCLDCHEASDFEGMSADEIATAIKGMMASEDHPEVIQELDAADVPDVAAYFAAEAAK
ncbi:MAG: hypothetical protein P8102_11725 [Gammaproteobacteria bacterium]